MDSNDQDTHLSKFEAALRPVCCVTDTCPGVVLLNPKLAEAARTKEQVQRAFRKGRPVEAQSSPSSNECITVGMTFIQPPALPRMPSLPAMPSIPAELPSLPGVPSLPTDLPSLPGVPSLPAELPSLPGLPSLPTEMPSLPGVPSLPKIPSLPPAAATLWGAFQQQPKLGSLSQFGANSALSALGDSFNGFNTEGYVDLNKNLGFEYALNACPAGSLSGDLEVEATVPRAAPFLAPVSIRHKMAVHQTGFRGRATIDHSTKLSMPVARGKGAAHVHIRPHIYGPALSLEVASKGQSAENSKKQPSPMIKQNIGAESDGEDAPQNSSISRIPCIKLELPPGGLLLPFFPKPSRPGRGGVALRWRQAWSSKVRTTAVYSSTSNKMQVDAHARVQPALYVVGGVSVDVGGEGKGPGVGQAVAKMIWRGRTSGFGKHAVHLESRYSNAGGLMHVVKLRHRPVAAAGAEADLSMKFRPQSATPSLQFDVFLPI